MILEHLDSYNPPQAQLNFAIEPFQPSFILRNPHIQTAVSFYFHNPEGVTFERHRLDTPNGDFLNIDLAHVTNNDWEKLGKNSPIVLLLHGLGGSSQSAYAPEFYRQLARVGIRSVGINYRSCGGEINNLPQTYHAGSTDDVALVVNWLRQQYPVPVGLIGVSLGAAITLNYLGEAMRDVAAAVTVSTPFDLRASAKLLGTPGRHFYNRSLISGLKRSYARKAEQIGSLVDMDKLMAVENLYEFDNVCTAPLHGFADAEDYYAQCDPKRHLSSIRTPTLVLRAKDDPFLQPEDIPFATIQQNPYLTDGITKHGGHVGFAETLYPITWWAQRQAARFLAACLFGSSL